LSESKRALLIRKATPNILGSLFETQNHLCDLCGFQIQDLICAAMDHSTPVVRFAKMNITIEDAIALANDRTNLRAVHHHCNHVKQNRTREQWFALGLDKTIEQPKVLTEGQLLELQFRLGSGGRVGGHRAHELHPNMAVTNGRTQGHKNKVNRTGIFAPEHHGKGGRVIGPITGRANVEQKRGIFSMTAEQHQEASRNAGRRVKELGVGIFAPENVGKGGHTRGHVQRNQLTPTCSHCCEILKIPYVPLTVAQKKQRRRERHTIRERERRGLRQ